MLSLHNLMSAVRKARANGSETKWNGTEMAGTRTRTYTSCSAVAQSVQHPVVAKDFRLQRRQSSDLVTHAKGNGNRRAGMGINVTNIYIHIYACSNLQHLAKIFFGPPFGYPWF